jgi:hypothetical protein
MYTGKHPFHEYSKEVTVIIKVMKGERPTRPDQDHCRINMKDTIWKLIEAAWHQIPTIRPSMLLIEDVLEDVWRPHRIGTETCMKLVFDAKHDRPAFVKLLGQACLDEACRDALLELKLTEAQVVVDAIQSVRA